LWGESDTGGVFVRNILKRAALSAVLVAGFIGVAPGVADAATPDSAGNAAAYDPAAICGADGYSYTVLTSSNLTYQGAGGTSAGKVYLLYSSGNGENCVVTIKSLGVGTADQTEAQLTVEGTGQYTDNGSYAYYAGPVRHAASGKCVEYYGSAQVGNTYYWGGRLSWGNCG
jgi:hypothetical protein